MVRCFVMVRKTTLHSTGTFIGGDTFGEIRTYVTQAVDRIYRFYLKKKNNIKTLNKNINKSFSFIFFFLTQRQMAFSILPALKQRVLAQNYVTSCLDEIMLEILPC